MKLYKWDHFFKVIITFKRVVKKTLRWVFFIFLGFIGLFAILWVTLQFPKVQTYIIGKVTNTLSAKLKVPVHIDRVNIHFFKTIVLNGIYIEDRQKDTLLYAGALKANVGLLSLAKKTININYIGLEDANINIYRKKGIEEYNFDFILKAFASDTTTTKDTSSGGWDFDMSEIQLQRIRLAFYDYTSKTDLNLSLKNLDVDIATLGLNDQHMKIDEIAIDALRLKYNMISSKELTDTLAVAAKETVKQSAQASDANVFKLDIGGIGIKGSAIAFNNENFPLQTKGIDFNHLGLSSFNASLKNITMAGSDFGGELSELKFLERSGFNLGNLAVKGSLVDAKLHVELNEFITPNSNLSNKVTVDISSLNDVQKQLGDIAVSAAFDDDVVAMKDILYFSPSLDTVSQLRNSKITINGQLAGKFSDITFENASIALNENNFIKGNFKLKGLPDIDKLAFDVSLNTLTLQGPYIASLLPKNAVPVNMAALGNIQVRLDAKGNMHQFKTNSKINTSAGSAGFNLQVALDNKYFPQALSGNIFTTKFDLGKLLGQQTKIGPLTMHANLKSKGQEIINLESTIQSFYYNKYNYNGIQIEGTYRNKIANAEIACSDSNLNIQLNGFFDLKKSPFLYDFTAQLKNVDLHKLKLYATPLKMHSNINVHAQGSDIDSLRAKFSMTDFMVMNDKVEYTLDTLNASADYNQGFKTIGISSPVLNAAVEGRFSYKEIPDAIQHLMSHYMSAFKPSSKPVHIDSVKFDIKIGDTKEITQIFAPSLTELNNIELKGSFTEASHILKLNGKVGHLAFGTQNVRNINLGVDGDKEKLNISFSSNTVALSPQVQFYNPSFKGVFSHDSLKFILGMKDTASTSRLNLDGSLTYRGDTFKLQLPTADIMLRGKDWKLSKEALFIYAPKYIVIRNFTLNSGEQQIEIATSGENTKRNLLHADLKAVELGDISKLIGLNFNLEGQLNGKTEIVNMMAGLGIKSDITISNLKADQRPVGDLTFSASKPENRGLLNVKTNLSGAGNEMTVAGNYDMNKTENNMDFKANIDNLNTSSIQPFVKDIFFILNGKLQANLALRGSANKPEVNGKIFFRDTHNVGITAIQTQYKIVNQEIIFNPGSVQFNNFVILDTANQAAKVNGFVNHEYMENIKVALTFDADNFQFIDSDNTTAPVFGKFIADVKVKVNGPVDNLVVNMNVLTKPKTDLSLNIATQQVLSGIPSYIKFVSYHNDTSGFKKISLDSSAVAGLPEVDMSRFKVSGFITVTKDANFNIIINPSTGDKIVARGDGKFRMSFDSNNSINLFGQFIIDQGSYGLSFFNVVKREFKIDKGSSIDFYGDPAEGEMDIRAIYTTKASRYDLVSDMGLPKSEENAAKIRQPVNLYLKLKGQFLKPDISFDIIVPESKNSMGAVAQRIEQMRNDQSQMNKQVFGLLVMNKFFPYDGGASAGGGGGGMSETAAGTVGSLVADQLNRLSEEYISGVSIDVNTETQTDINNNVSNNVSVMATKQVSDRLKIGVGGKSNISNSGSTQGVAGEYEIEYQINKSGSASIKLFSTSQQNIYTNSNNQVSGFSLNHSKGFDKVKEIFR